MNKRHTAMWEGLKHNFLQFWIALDQLLNVLISILLNPFSFENWADETISSRCGRLGHRYPYKALRVVIDFCFEPWQGPNHCWNAYLKERARYNFPPDMRS